MIDSRNPTERPPTPEFDRSRISFDIRMGLHRHEDDFADLEPLLKRGGYDIYIPESVGHTPESEKVDNQIVRGNTTFYQRAMANLQPGEPIRGMVKAMFATHINLFFADYTKEQLAADEDQRFLILDLPISQLKNLDGITAYFVDRDQRAARNYGRRDDNIVHNINTKLPSFINQHPKLRDRDDIRTLISIGTLHVGLPGKLSDQGYKVRTFGQPAILTPMMELQIRAQTGQEVDRNLLVQAVLGSFIELVMIHNNSTRLAEIVCQISANVPEQTVEELLANYELYGTPVLIQFVRRSIENLAITDHDLDIING